MKYYKYYLLERHGDMEVGETSVIALEDDADLEDEGHRLAMENRDSEKDDYDKDMNAYWCDSMVTFVPGFEEIPHKAYLVLKNHI